MQYTRSTEDTYVLRIDRGEKVLAWIASFCTSEGIQNGFFRGIGAVEGLTCGYYALEEKAYHFIDYPELVEVASLIGNVALKDGVPFVHAHGVFTNTKNEAFGGHIQEMTAGVVVEVVLETLPTRIERAHDELTGLFLMSCENKA